MAKQIAIRRNLMGSWHETTYNDPEYIDFCIPTHFLYEKFNVEISIKSSTEKETIEDLADVTKCKEVVFIS